jgi:hypothetical protein
MRDGDVITVKFTPLVSTITMDVRPGGDGNALLLHHRYAPRVPEA